MTPHLLASALATLLVLAGCGGSSSPSPTDRDEPPIAAALAVAQPGELVEEARRLVRQRGELRAQQAGAGVGDPALSLAGEPVMLAQATSADRATSAAPTAKSGIAYTGTTTLQEAGVDEDDLVKTDGSLIYALQRAGWYGGSSQPDRLHRYERQADGSLSEPLVLELPTDERTHTSMRGMLVAPQGGRIALIGESNTWFAPIDCPPDRACILGGAKFYSAPKTVLQWVETGGASPMLGERIEIDGSLIGTRRIGDYLYLVMTHTPQLAAESLWMAAAGDPVAREAALASIRIEDLMPTLSVVGGRSQLALEETDCHLQTANQSSALQLTLVLAFDMRAGPSAESGPIWSGRCFLGGTEALYMAPQSMYLATTRYPVTTEIATGRMVYSAQARTDIHKFAIDGPSIRYRGSGEVPGHLGWNRDRAAYRMSEHQGDLRVLSYTGPTGWASAADAADASRPASPATLTVLREAPDGGGGLQPIASLPNAKRPAPLGKPGEQIYGVRFAGEHAYLVTFRQIDPLYVVDLSKPTDPRIRGELEMPGYSDYLYPLPGDLLLGIGKDASLSGMVGGIKLGLYNLSSVDSPKELSTIILGGPGSIATLDYSSHGVSLYSQQPVTVGALPVWLRGRESGAETGRGLQIIELDQVGKTLSKRKFVQAFDNDEGAGIESDRALMVDGDVYYWAGGKMRRVELPGV